MRRLAAALVLAAGLALPAGPRSPSRPVTSPGGITAWLYEEHSLPMLNIEASFQGGAALDPPGQAGAASMMAALLGEGAGDLDATGLRRGGRGAGGLAGLRRRPRLGRRLRRRC